MGWEHRRPILANRNHGYTVSLSFGLLLLLSTFGWAQTTPPCTDLSQAACREAFTNANLPRFKTIAVNSPKLAPIKSALTLGKRAETMERSRLDEIEGMEKVLSGDLRQDPKKAPATIENIIAEKKLLLDAQKEKYRWRNEAIRLTKDIYELTPGVTVAPKPDPNMPGAVEIKPWNPHYSDNVKYEVDARGHTFGRLLKPKERIALAVKLGQPPGTEADHTAGTRKDNASIGMFPRSFDRPELLAAQIYHETVHWLDAAARGRSGTPFESFAGEIKAYTLVADNAAAFGLSSNVAGELRKTAGIYGKQLPKSVGLTWGQVEKNHPDWLYADAPLIDAAGPTDSEPEPTKVQADFDFLNSWSQAAMVLSEKARTALAVQKAEERRRREEQEDIMRAVLAARAQHARDELKVEAARCGYGLRIVEQPDLAIFDFNDQHSYHGGSKQSLPPLNLEYAKILFMIARACDSVTQPNYSMPNEMSCNETAPRIYESLLSPEFHAQMNFMLGLPPGPERFNQDGTGNCVYHALIKSGFYSDTKAFVKIMTAYKKSEHARIAKENALYTKNRREREAAERRSSRPPQDDSDRYPPSSPNHDEVWRRVNPIIGR